MRVTVHVRPNSSQTRVGGEHDGALVVRVSAPPDHGKATAAVLDALAQALALPRRTVRLASGASSRRKVVDLAVPAAGVADLERRLDELRQTL